uniref:ATP synthase subunit gamma n=1 Tax=Prasinoderma singulare TaxID=676789 RepID=A0A7S3FJ70_9VIRI
MSRRAAMSAASAARGLFKAPLGAAGSALPFGARGNAGQLNIVKQRMKSVRNVEKITKAMKMVAASKLRQAETKMALSRGIWMPFYRLFGNPVDAEAENVLLVPFTSDKGLCGGVNSTIVKYSRALMELQSESKSSMVVIGEKGKAQLERKEGDKINSFIGDMAKVTITFPQVSMIADKVLEEGKFDKTHVLFNHFKSIISNKPTIATVGSPELIAKEKQEELNLYEFEEGFEENMQDLVELQLATTMWNAALENSTSENGARMNAMDSSSKNASEMLEKLTLIFNRGRQASITTELIEIISGATALEG